MTDSHSSGNPPATPATPTKKRTRAVADAVDEPVNNKDDVMDVEGAAVDRPISPMPKGKGRGKKVGEIEVAKGKGKMGDPSASSGTSSRPSASIRASNRLKNLKGSDPGPEKTTSSTSLFDAEGKDADGDSNMDRFADFGGDEGGESSRAVKARKEKGKEKERGMLDAFAEGFRSRSSRSAAKSPHPLSRGGSVVDEALPGGQQGAGRNGDQADEDDGDDDDDEDDFDVPETSRLGIHSASSEFAGMTKEQVAAIREKEIATRAKKKEMVKAYLAERGGAGAGGNGKGEGKGKAKAKADAFEGDDKERANPFAANNQADDQGEKNQSGVKNDNPKPDLAAPVNVQGAEIDAAVEDPGSSSTPIIAESKTEQRLLPRGTILKVGQGKSFLYPSKRWVEVVGDDGDENGSGGAAEEEVAQETSGSEGITANPVDSTEQVDGEEAAGSLPAGGNSAAGPSHPTPPGQLKCKLKQVDATVPHQYYRVVRQAGQGRLRVYECKGITGCKVRRRKQKLEKPALDSSTADAPDPAASTVPETAIPNPAPSTVPTPDTAKKDVSEPSFKDVKAEDDPLEAEDEEDWEWVWEWTDIADMPVVAIKMQYLEGNDQDVLKREFKKMRECWERFALDGDITLIAEPICYGDVMLKLPAEEHYRAGSYTAIVYPLYEGLYDMLCGKRKPISESRRKMLLQLAISAMDRFNEYYIHLDIKLKNLVIEKYTCPHTGEERERVRIIDAGGAKERGTELPKRKGLTGTYRYMCPSVLAAMVRRWMLSAKFKSGGDEKVKMSAWIELRGMVKAHQFHKLYEDIDQWSMGVQILEILNPAYLAKHYHLETIVHQLKDHLKSPSVSFATVEKSLEDISISLDHLTGSQTWRKETDESYHDLLSHCLQRPSSSGFYAVMYRDRRAGLLEGLKALMVAEPEAEVKPAEASPASTSQGTYLVGKNKPPIKLSRNESVREDPLGFYPESVSFKNGLGRLKLNKDGCTYGASMKTRFDGQRLLFPDYDLLSQYGFHVKEFRFRCGLPGCCSATYLGLGADLRLGGVPMHRLKQHVHSKTSANRGARCAWFMSHRFEGQMPVEMEAMQNKERKLRV